MDLPIMGQGPLKPLSEEDKKRDKHGFTHPNLHRRLSSDEGYKAPGEFESRSYQIGLYGVCSWRTTKKTIHSESSIDDETP